VIACSYYVSESVTLRLGVYRQSVRLGDKTLETHDQNFYFPTEHLRLYSLCNTLCNERMGLASAVILRSESQILLSQIRDSPNLEGKVPVFISPSNRVARLYPQVESSEIRVVGCVKGKVPVLK
jgi:hypothetical protein